MPSERDRNFLVVRFLHTSGHMFFYQTPARRPPRVTHRAVNTVTRGWVGALSVLAPFRLHDTTVVGFVDGCLSRTRDLTASN